MNAPSDLHKRLLKLYPVKVVKDTFNPVNTTQAEMIPEIVIAETRDSLMRFAVENHNYTKQHISFFKINGNFDRANLDLNSLPIPAESEVLINGVYTFSFLPIVTYNVVLGSPYGEEELKFYQPTTLTIQDDILIIQSTTMEKNLESYFPKRKVYEAKKAEADDYFVNLLLEAIESSYVVNILDLNKGVKALWGDDSIDSKHAKWKKSHSTRTESMDEEFTLKEKYPGLYKELVNAPLSRTIFKYIKDDDTLISHFSADPSKGTISISIYPDDLDQTKNVIKQILLNN